MNRPAIPLLFLLYSLPLVLPDGLALDGGTTIVEAKAHAT